MSDKPWAAWGLRREPDLDLDDDHWLWWFEWDPDVEMNPQWTNLPPIEPGTHCGAEVGHLRADGTFCLGGIHFDIPRMRVSTDVHARWQVQSWEPLTVSPSLLCKMPLRDSSGNLIAGAFCGDHGFIRNGRWVRA